MKRAIVITSSILLLLAAMCVHSYNNAMMDVSNRLLKDKEDSAQQLKEFLQRGTNSSLYKVVTDGNRFRVMYPDGKLQDHIPYDTYQEAAEEINGLAHAAFVMYQMEYGIWTNAVQPRVPTPAPILLRHHW